MPTARAGLGNPQGRGAEGARLLANADRPPPICRLAAPKAGCVPALLRELHCPSVP